ncbi:hypothetical protein [Micrococcoides hystricis]|uniref:Gram-positive cocci surface proteins LPxTG domain-containing protein n=1 Tax=Micrococcoides hystricis TaxID=1572761 RepID=A0ABV6PB39_9MICC
MRSKYVRHDLGYAINICKVRRSIAKDYESGKLEIDKNSSTHDVVPEVRYRNRWDSPPIGDSSRGYSMAGDYYYAISIADNEKVFRGIPIKVKFTVDVTGTPSGQPEFPEQEQPQDEQSSPGQSEDQGEANAGGEQAAGSDGGANLPLILGIGAAVVVVGALGFLLGRRKKS